MCKGASFSLVYCLRLQWSCVYLIHWIGYPDKAPDTSNIAFRNCPVSSDISLKVKEQAGHVRQFPKRKLTEHVRRTSRHSVVRMTLVQPCLQLLVVNMLWQTKKRRYNEKYGGYMNSSMMHCSGWFLLPWCLLLTRRSLEWRTSSSRFRICSRNRTAPTPHHHVGWHEPLMRL